ncbi:MAG TPA: hypothetical protein VNK04_27270 [Gemmataceae bacterium]|nr:hypothetical protein [Gemmataceae bacterium]
MRPSHRQVTIEQLQSHEDVVLTLHETTPAPVPGKDVGKLER